MMAAEGAMRPVCQVIEESVAAFDPDACIGAVKGCQTSTDGRMLSHPCNLSTPVLWATRDRLEGAGIDPDVGLTTWSQVGHELAPGSRTGSYTAPRRRRGGTLRWCTGPGCGRGGQRMSWAHVPARGGMPVPACALPSCPAEPGD